MFLHFDSRIKFATAASFIPRRQFLAVYFSSRLVASGMFVAISNAFNHIRQPRVLIVHQTQSAEFFNPMRTNEFSHKSGGPSFENSFICFCLLSLFYCCFLFRRMDEKKTLYENSKAIIKEKKRNSCSSRCIFKSRETANAPKTGREQKRKTTQATY